VHVPLNLLLTTTTTGLRIAPRLVRVATEEASKRLAEAKAEVREGPP
jgi:hypothetical protein